MRQLAWKVETAHSISDVEQERKSNNEVRDEWATRLNSNLAFVETYFGNEARNTLEQDITGGFKQVHEEFNDLFKSGKLDKDAIKKIEDDIDALNPKIYMFDVSMEGIINDRAGKCTAIP